MTDDIVSRLRTTSTTYVTPKPENAVGSILLDNRGPGRIADLIEAARRVNEWMSADTPRMYALARALGALEEAGK